MRGAIGDVLVVADMGAVDDGVEALPPGAVAANADTPEPMTPGDVVPVLNGDTVVEEFPDTGEDVLLFGVDVLELVNDERDEVGVVCVNSSAIPLLPITDPVWMLAIGLHGVDEVFGWPGAWLCGVPGLAVDSTCAIAVDAYATLIQTNKKDFIINLLYRSAGRFTAVLVQVAGQDLGSRPSSDQQID